MQKTKLTKPKTKVYLYLPNKRNSTLQKTKLPLYLSDTKKLKKKIIYQFQKFYNFRVMLQFTESTVAHVFILLYTLHILMYTYNMP